MNPNTASFLKLLRNPLKSRLFLFFRLPSAWFSGVRVRKADEGACMVSVPYKWFSKNPFRSTYFACLSMAAEMSTGALAMAHSYKRSPSVSMLVVKVESEYYKKATGRTEFTCSDGQLINEAIEESSSSGEPKTVRAKSVGKNKEGETVAEFVITWSFKSRKNNK